MLLQKTRTALKNLVNALDRPQDPAITTEEFFGIAFKVKQDVEALRAARKATK
jgi:hypothetical protein